MLFLVKLKVYKNREDSQKEWNSTHEKARPLTPFPIPKVNYFNENSWLVGHLLSITFKVSWDEALLAHFRARVGARVVVHVFSPASVVSSASVKVGRLKLSLTYYMPKNQSLVIILQYTRFRIWSHFQYHYKTVPTSKSSLTSGWLAIIFSVWCILHVQRE